MAGYQNWMNPTPQAAHMDRLLNSRAGVMGEREHTIETVNPRWNLPWQGNADFLTEVPNTDQREGLQYDIDIDGNTESFNFDEELTPQGMESFRRRQGITPEIPQTQRPARQTNKWPWGQSISNMFRGAMNQIIPPAY